MGHLLALRMVALTSAAALLVVAMGPMAEAHHRPKTYCRDDGYMCQSAGWTFGAHRLQISTLRLEFRRYRLCVLTPYYERRTCRTFRMTQRNGSWGDSVLWREHFPYSGIGGYTVVWKRMNGERIGRKLGFHVRD